MPQVPALPDAPGPSGPAVDEDGLEPRVGAALADDGALARAMPAFEPRPGQRRMAAAAARVLESGGVLLAEAGTGTGKTLAYLVPAILSGERVLVSTGTRNLQDQIYYKDLPAVADALGVTVQATCMKGRANYLCRHRFEAARAEAGSSLLPSVDRGWLEQLAEWAAQTETGDRAEVEDLPDDLPLWQDISASSENCIGSDCPAFQECFVTTMRQRAAESDVVIVNHHLLCADAAVRHGAYGAVIPDCDAAVIDEAHQIEDVATQYFGVSVSPRRFEDLGRDVRRLVSGESSAPEIEEAAARDLLQRLDRVRDGALRLFEALGRVAPGFGERTRVTSDSLAAAAEPGRRLDACLRELASGLAALAGSGAAASADTSALERRANEMGKQLAFLLAADDNAYVYFLERRARSLHLRAAPIDVSGIVREQLLEPKRTAILTSATLTVDSSFAYVRGRLGIDEAVEVRVPSEFDYAEQSILYLPRDVPAPRQPGFAAAVAREADALLRVTEGRAFVLFTSYATLREVRARLEGRLPYPVLVQGSAPRTVLLREFRETPNAVLLATSSFWQGVDVAGEALSCVVIDKIPFAPPGDPLTAARLEQIAEDGGNPFADYQVPLAILTLLQGLGRLLRHRTDRGVLALLDPRLRTRGYGRRFLESLPPAPVTHDLAAVERFFHGAGADPAALQEPER